MNSLETLAGFTSWYLPNIGAALVIAMLVTAVAGKFTNRPGLLLPGFLLVLLLCLVPLDGTSLSHQGRIITGDLSVVTLVWFTLRVINRLLLPVIAPYVTPAVIKSGMKRQSTAGGNAGYARRYDQQYIAAVIVVTALLLYPTALGLTWFDLYAFGYYPVLLAPILFALFAWCLWFGHALPAAMLALAFSCWALGVLESDNLWDYLIDPVVTIYAVIFLARYWHRTAINPIQLRRRVEAAALFMAGSVLGFAVFLSRFDLDGFQYQMVIEDGFIEWCGLLAMAVTILVCARRVYVLRQARRLLFLAVTSLPALLCLFDLGLAPFWTPFWVPGLIFCLLVASPFYRANAAVRSFFDQLAAPMPGSYHIIGYLLILALAELLIDSSRRGEMIEFAGSIVFALNVIYPANREIFDIDRRPLRTDSQQSAEP